MSLRCYRNGCGRVYRREPMSALLSARFLTANTLPFAVNSKAFVCCRMVKPYELHPPFHRPNAGGATACLSRRGERKSARLQSCTPVRASMPNQRPDDQPPPQSQATVILGEPAPFMRVIKSYAYVPVAPPPHRSRPTRCLDRAFFCNIRPVLSTPTPPLTAVRRCSWRLVLAWAAPRRTLRSCAHKTASSAAKCTNPVWVRCLTRRIFLWACQSPLAPSQSACTPG